MYTRQTLLIDKLKSKESPDVHFTRRRKCSAKFTYPFVIKNSLQMNTKRELLNLLGLSTKTYHTRELIMKI